MAKMLILGLVNGDPTPFDGTWLVDYDPTRPGTDPGGRPMIAHLVTTDDPRQAREFGSAGEAEAFWKQAHGVRKDGRPNRPLTAFVIEIRPIENRVAIPHTPTLPTGRLVAFVSEFFFSSPPD